MQLFKRSFLLGLVLVWVGVLSGCDSLQKAAFQKPTAKFAESRLTDLTLNGATLEIVLDVHNPNSYPINLGALDYDFEIQGARFGQGSQANGNKLEAGKSSKVVLPLTVGFSDLAKLVQNLGGLNKLDYAVKGGMTFVLPVVGDYRAKYSAKGELPKPVMPEISIASLKQEKFGLTGASYKAVLNVKNPNVFDLNLQQLNYGLSLNNQQLTQGKLAEQKLKSGKTTQVELPINIGFNPASLGSLYQILSKGGELDYKVDFDSEIASSLPILKPFSYKGSKAGNLNLVK